MSCPTGNSGDLCHPALVYATPDEFLTTAVPFLRDGVAAREAALVVTSARNVSALTDALGETTAFVQFHAAETFLTTPWRALVSYRRWIDRRSAGGRRVRVIGEPFAPRRSAAAAREWTRYESLLNTAFAALPLTILCPYDASALDPRIVEDARRTHPALLSPDQRLVASADYADVRTISTQLDRIALEPPRAPVAEHALARDLRDARRFVAGQAAAAGVATLRIEDVAFAAHEVAANACTHGGGDAVLRTWSDAGEFLCEISDRGAGMADALAGSTEPAIAQPNGRGLWLARQLCDLVQVRTGAGGTVVRLHVTLP